MSWLDQIPEPTLGLRLKRALDIGVSGACLVAAAPVLGVVSAVSMRVHGRPLMFEQARPGLYGRIFRIRKLRTMTDACGPDGELLPDAERLTRFGQFLRSTSIDELPELYQVLVGDMSLVGPRPLLPAYLERYSAEQMRRHEMPPGITGWAQVHGRNSTSWEERFALDVHYVDNWSLLLDLEILLRTVAVVLQRDGISAEGAATMPGFQGAEAG